MNICYVADARSPIAKNWISHFVERQHQVTVISSYPCAADEIPGTRIVEFPFALSSLSRMSVNARARNGKLARFSRLIAEFGDGAFLQASNEIRTWIAPLDIRRKTEAMSRLLREIQPDIVHAMRLPYEGFLAAAAAGTTPLLLSVWGNDFTLFADQKAKLGRLANSALLRADGLHCDCRRDLKIAMARGFSSAKPWRVLPGNGGIDTDSYFSSRPDPDLLREFGIPEGAPLVINPRGFRAYVRNDTFFRAIPLVLKHVPDACFLATGMFGNPVAERRVRRMGISGSVRLLPTVSREQLVGLFAASQVSVSPSSHDGTPNTLLEAMACGCFPVVGNVESLREWITDGANGLICDESNPHSLASSIVQALRDSALRETAGKINRRQIRERAEYAMTMTEAEALYREVAANKKTLVPSGAEQESALTTAEIC